MNLNLMTKDISDPTIFSEIMGLQRKYLKNEIEEITFSDSPPLLQEYFRYLDKEEREQLEVYKIPSIDAFFAEWDDDAYISCGDIAVCAPYKARDYIWMFNQGSESARWELDMEERLAK